MDEATIKKAVGEAIEEKLGEFFIAREQHYQDHQFISGVRTFGERVKGQACKTITSTMVIAFFTMIVYGVTHWARGLFDSK